MRSEYQRDVHNNYLILENDRHVEETSYPVRMLLANALPAILKCRLQRMDGKMLFYYEITSRQSLEDFYEKKKFSFEDLQMIFGNFVQLIEKMAEYLLNPDQLVLQPEFIFMDVEKKNMYFCYLPGYEKPIRDQFQMLTEYVLPKLDHEDSKAVMLGYGIYRRALEEGFHLEHIKEEVYHAQSGENEKKEEKKDAMDLNSKSDTMKAMGKPDKVEENSEPDLFFVSREEESDTKRGKEGWKKVLVFTAGCILATGILILIMLGEQMGYLPRLGVEVNVGILILLVAFFSLVGYLLQKMEKKEKKVSSLQEKKISTQMDRKNTLISEENEGKEWNNRLHQEEYYEQKEPKEDKKIKKIETFQKVSGKVPNTYGETVILSEEPVKGPATFVSREPGELATIYIQKELTIIGKLETASDAVISLPTISRVHAKVKRMGDDYYLTDLNSRNGTSVNGRMLKAEEEYLLQEEDQVDFAQARYIFLK